MKTVRRHVSLFVAFITLVAATFVDFTHFSMSYICSNTSISSRLTWLVNVTKPTSCAVMCKENPECRSFTYSASDMNCTLYASCGTWFSTCGSNVLYGKYVPSNISCTNPVNNTRLCDGAGRGFASPYYGRIEVYYNNTWGSVCDDNWVWGWNGDPNAKVVCRLLGYKNSVTEFWGFGQSCGPIHLDEVSCTHVDLNLADCLHLNWGVHDCTHDEDVGVTCS